MEIFADFAQYPPPMTDSRNPLVGAAVPSVNAYHCPPPPVAPEPEMIQYDYTKPRDYPKHQYLFPYSVKHSLYQFLTLSSSITPQKYHHLSRVQYKLKPSQLQDQHHPVARQKQSQKVKKLEVTY